MSCVSGGLDHCRMVDKRQKVFLETLKDFVDVCLVQCLWKYFASVNIWWNKLISAWKYSSKYLWTSVSCVSGGLDLDHCRMVDMRQEVAALAQPGHQELQHPSQGQNIFWKLFSRTFLYNIIEEYFLSLVLAYVLRSSGATASRPETEYFQKIICKDIFRKYLTMISPENISQGCFLNPISAHA